MSITARALAVVSALGLAAAMLVIAAVPARAHAGGGAEPSNHQVEVTSRPAGSLGVELGAGGQWIRVTRRTEATVTVLGYAGEPSLRIGADGVAVNRHSTVAADNSRLSSVPVQLDPSAPPQWVAVSSDDSIAWSDDRLTPGSGGDTNATWTIPVRVENDPAAIGGTRTYVPAPSPWPWVGGLLASTLAVAALGWLSRPYRPAAVALALGGAANAAHLVVGALGPHKGSAVSAWGAALGLGLLCWPLVVVGVVAALRRGEHADFALAVAGAVLAVVTGPGDLGVLWHSQLPFPGPPALERALVVTAFGAGIGLVAAGIRMLRATPPREEAGGSACFAPAPVDEGGR